MKYNVRLVENVLSGAMQYTQTMSATITHTFCLGCCNDLIMMHLMLSMLGKIAADAILKYYLLFLPGDML